MGDGGHLGAATAGTPRVGRIGSTRHQGERRPTDALRTLGASRRVASGAALFRQGDAGTTVYLLEHGLVRLTVDAGTHPVAVSTAWPGDVIGAVDVLAGQPRGATATAATDIRVIAVPGAAFADVVDRDQTVRHSVLRQLSAELATAHGRLVSQCSQSTVVRVATTLLALSADETGPGHTVRTTQGALAEWIGATRESTARALGELRHHGWITTGRGWIRLDDPDALARFAGC